MPDAQGRGNDCFKSFPVQCLPGSLTRPSPAQTEIATAQYEREVGDSPAR
jgi:hypothetical protein